MKQRRLILGLLSLLLACAAPAGGLAQDDSRANEAIDFAVDAAETRAVIALPSFPEPFVPMNGAYLIVWVNVVNTGAAAKYDFCTPDVACLDPFWFEVVNETGTAYPVDELARAAVDSVEEGVLRFGGEIPAGGEARIVLAFDVPAGAASWTLRGTDVATAPFSLPISASTPVAATVEAPFRMVDAAGAVMGEEVGGGKPVEVPPGISTVEVVSAQTATIANVVVASGARVEASWDDR